MGTMKTTKVRLTVSTSKRKIPKMFVRNTMAYYINIGMCVATKNVKNVEAFRVTVVNLLTKKAKYWGATNVAENESRNQEKLVEGMEEKHHVNLQYDEFQRARMITRIIDFV